MASEDSKKPPMGDVVNLNRFRKKKAREERAKRAETNRRLHGRTQAEKDRERAERDRAARALEGKRLQPEAPPAEGVVVPLSGASAPPSDNPPRGGSEEG